MAFASNVFGVRIRVSGSVEHPFGENDVERALLYSEERVHSDAMDGGRRNAGRVAQAPRDRFPVGNRPQVIVAEEIHVLRVVLGGSLGVSSWVSLDGFGGGQNALAKSWTRTTQESDLYSSSFAARALQSLTNSS